MKNILAFSYLARIAAALACGAVIAGCKNGSSVSDAPRKPIPLAPVGVASSGIGGPGGDSADTRATGTVATGEGDEPLDTRSGVAPITAAPGSVRATAGGGH